MDPNNTNNSNTPTPGLPQVPNPSPDSTAAATPINQPAPTFQPPMDTSATGSGAAPADNSWNIPSIEIPAAPVADPSSLNTPAPIDPSLATPGAPVVADSGLSMPPATPAMPSLDPMASPPAPADSQPDLGATGGAAPIPTFAPPVDPISAPPATGSETAAPSFDPSVFAPPSDSTSPANETPSPMEHPAPVAEAAPTDLSHLMGTLSGGTEATPAVAPVQPAQPESLMAPPPPPAASQVVTSGHSIGFPKWLLAVGVLVVLGVIGASAYFILGIGKTQQAAPAASIEETNSEGANGGFVPAEVPTETIAPTQSAGLVEMQLLSPTPQSTSSGTDSAALELLRRRQDR